MHRSFWLFLLRLFRLFLLHNVFCYLLLSSTSVVIPTLIWWSIASVWYSLKFGSEEIFWGGDEVILSYRFAFLSHSSSWLNGRVDLLVLWNRSSPGSTTKTSLTEMTHLYSFSKRYLGFYSNKEMRSETQTFQVLLLPLRNVFGLNRFNKRLCW